MRAVKQYGSECAYSGCSSAMDAGTKASRRVDGGGGEDLGGGVGVSITILLREKHPRRRMVGMEKGEGRTGRDGVWQKWMEG